MNGVKEGRLNGFRSYLVGPIDRCPDGGVGWRRDICHFLRGIGVAPLDPTNKPIDTELEDEEHIVMRKQLKADGKFDEAAAIMKRIRAIDLRMCDLCDFVVGHLDLNIFACGTLEEIFWCNRMKKPILVHVEQGKENVPDWLLGVLPHSHIFGSWYDLKQYILHVHVAEKVDHMKRWCFLDYKRLEHVL